MTDALPLADCRVLCLGESGVADVCGRILGQLGVHVVRLSADAPSDIPVDVAGPAYDLIIDGRAYDSATGRGEAWPTPSSQSGIVVAVTRTGLGPHDDGHTEAEGLLAGFHPDVVDALTGAHAAVAALAGLRWQ